MKRIFTFLVVALVVAAVIVVMAMPAFARAKHTPPAGPNASNACQGPNDQPTCPSPR